jgi:hypothetical protein
VREFRIDAELQFRISPRILKLAAKFVIRPSQVLVFQAEPVDLTILVRFSREIERRSRYRHKKTGDEQTGGKRQKKWQDSLQHSFIQHATHLLKASIIVYAGFSKTVSKIGPQLLFYSITLDYRSKAFCFREYVAKEK